MKLLRENNANDAGSAIADLLANPALRENTLENVHISQASLQSAFPERYKALQGYDNKAGGSERRMKKLTLSCPVFSINASFVTVVIS